MNCRFCNTLLSQTFIDLVNSPPSNSFLTPEQENEPEVYFPLKLYVCEKCHLVQIDEYKSSREIFSEQYIYFSSFSTTWTEHAKRYSDMITQRLSLDDSSFVIEIASNDGYLLQFFKKKGIPCMGIEPAEATAEAARRKGIEVTCEFFSSQLGQHLKAGDRQADLLVGNNVLAHVPDINDFVAGLKHALAPSGTITMEFPHLMRLIKENQFDTIYHEHFSYLSFHTVEMIFKKHGLDIFDVDELPTHGGSLRIYAMHKEKSPGKTSKAFDLLAIERDEGMLEMPYYDNFQESADKVKYDLLFFLLQQKKKGKKVACYGAAAKGNTLLNYCGIKKDLISFCVDASEYKQGKIMPGTHIPVFPVTAIYDNKPDFVIILPWNIKEEIVEQLHDISEWGGKFAIPVPCLKIL